MGLTSLLAILGLLAGSVAGANELRTTVYVAPSGSDSAVGSSAAPLRTIAAAVARTPSNGVIIIRSGTYHENITLVGKSGRTLKAAPGASVWMDGSRAVTNWRASGSRWVSSGWAARFDASPTFTPGAPDARQPGWRFVNSSHPMAAHPDQMWIDGAAQRQVGSLSAVKSGTFYVNYGKSQLVLGSRPTGHQVRASDLPKAISIRESGTTVSGINVTRYAPSVPTMGAVTIERPNVTVTNMKITNNATTGLFVGSSDARVTDVTVARNGMNGMLGNHADRLTMTRVAVTRNNLERFNSAPSAGGAKFGRSTAIRVNNSRFTGNYGTGLWFDMSVYDMKVFGSKMTNNVGNGIALEISGTAKVANNVISGNSADGLKINNTDHVDVWNNTMIGNHRAVDIVQDPRDLDLARSTSLPMTFRSQWVTVRNNIIARPGAGVDCMLCVEDYSHRFSARQLHISTNANVYQIPSKGKPRWLTVWSRGAGNPAVYTTLRGMRSTTGQEKRGRLLNGTPALTAANRPTAAVTRLMARTAYPTPGWLASAARVAAGSKHLGAWLN